MTEFVIEERAEPPKAYIDSLEKSKTLEFVTYTTKIVCNENGSEKMTEQEAIENFKEENKILSQYAESKFQKEVFAKKIERNNMAIKALEKQIPKEIYHFDDNTFETSCCGIDVTNEDFKYCPECGQLLGGVEEIENEVN